MKKSILILMAFVLCFSLFACSNNQNPDQDFDKNYQGDSAVQEEKIGELKTPPEELKEQNSELKDEGKDDKKKELEELEEIDSLEELKELEKKIEDLNEKADMGNEQEEEATTPTNNNDNTMAKPTYQELTKEEHLAPPKKGDQIAVIETNMGTIKFKFFKDHSPELSKNFIELAKDNYYDGVIFHRIIEGFMIQGGDPDGNGTGGHSYKGEGKGLADEEGALSLKHYPGAVACAKSSLPNSIGSQFYIVHGDAMFLNGNYSVFGQVFEGQDVVDAIGQVETNAQDKPKKDVVMKKVTITTQK